MEPKIVWDISRIHTGKTNKLQQQLRTRRKEVQTRWVLNRHYQKLNQESHRTNRTWNQGVCGAFLSYKLEK